MKRILIAMLCVCAGFAGRHQCRALAESMFSPKEGLKEINHQLSTGVAQELIHYCNSQEGVFAFFFTCTCVCVFVVQTY